MFRTILPRRVVVAPRQSPLSTSTSTTVYRSFSQQTRTLAAKDSQHKDSIKPETNEYSKSGSDASAAAIDKTAFDPNQTRPEEQERSAETESKNDSNPLNVSAANPEVSKPKNTEGGAAGSKAEAGSEGSSGRARTSGGDSPSKGGEGKRYSS